MVLLSLEDSEEVILCGGRKWRHNRAHPRERLQTTGR